MLRDHAKIDGLGPIALAVADHGVPARVDADGRHVRPIRGGAAIDGPALVEEHPYWRRSGDSDVGRVGIDLKPNHFGLSIAVNIGGQGKPDRVGVAAVISIHGVNEAGVDRVNRRLVIDAVVGLGSPCCDCRPHGQAKTERPATHQCGQGGGAGELP